MQNAKIEVDETLPFGGYAAGRVAGRLIRITRALPSNWLGKRLMFLLRGIARKRLRQCVDTTLFGARLRLYTGGNLSEKRALFAPQFFDLDEREEFQKLAAPGAVFIDIGANVGLYSFSVGQTFRGFEKTRIIAVEPHPEIHRRLAFNKSLNPSMPIELFQGGIGDREDEMQLLTGDDNLGQTRILRADEAAHPKGISVPITTLISLCEKFDLNRIDGMKIDVEGFEEAVLLPFFEHASDQLLPRLIVIEDNRDDWEADILAAATKRGYRLARKTRMNLLLRRG
jgi:FkbM family methyltransferase